MAGDFRSSLMIYPICVIKFDENQIIDEIHVVRQNY